MPLRRVCRASVTRRTRCVGSKGNLRKAGNKHTYYGVTRSLRVVGLTVVGRSISDVGLRKAGTEKVTVDLSRMELESLVQKKGYLGHVSDPWIRQDFSVGETNLPWCFR